MAGLIELKNDHILLLEFFVERVVLNDNVNPNLQAGRTTVDFQFLAMQPITVDAPITKETPLCASPAMNVGKTCMFSLTPKLIEKASENFDLYIRVFQSKKCGAPQSQLVGIALMPLTSMFNEVVRKAGDKATDSPPGASKFIKNSVPLTDLDNYPTVVGYICASVRLSCYGKFIMTDFQMNMDQKSIDYKANAAKYRLKYHRKFDPCPEICGPGMEVPCSSPRICGLSNPMIDPTPMPSAPGIKLTLSSKINRLKGGGKAKAKGKGGKAGKGKGGKDKGKAKRKSAPSITPGSCKSDISCLDTCPNVYTALQEKKFKEEQEKLKASGMPSPCPPSCYEKERLSHVKWNDCPPSCTSAPPPEKGECPSCCAVEKAFNPQICPPPGCEDMVGPRPCPPKGPCSPNEGPPCCSFITTQPGEQLGPQIICPKSECTTSLQMSSQSQAAPQYAPAFYIGPNAPVPQSSPPAQALGSCGCEQQRPVTMMYASEPNYAPNPQTDMFQMDMGLGGSLCCRVRNEYPPATTPCPVNYMPPPTLNGQSPFASAMPGSPGNMNAAGFGNAGPPCLRPRPPQTVDMRPGMNENTPFRLTVGDGAIKQNQLCVSPPTYVAEDGTKYTELSDPQRKVFVMRIGKKYEGTMGGRNNIDLHLTTPPPGEPDPEYDASYQQYNLADTLPGATYTIGGITIPTGKPTKEGKGKKGKGGKGKKGKGGKAGKKGKGKKK